MCCICRALNRRPKLWVPVNNLKLADIYDSCQGRYSDTLCWYSPNLYGHNVCEHCKKQTQNLHTVPNLRFYLVSLLKNTVVWALCEQPCFRSLWDKSWRFAVLPSCGRDGKLLLTITWRRKILVEKANQTRYSRFDRYWYFLSWKSSHVVI